MGRAIQPVITSLCALHSLEHPERFTELPREEKREEDDKTSRLMVKQFSTQGTRREVHRVTWRREEGGRR